MPSVLLALIATPNAMKKFNILFIHKDPCARAYKEAVALTRRGHTIDLAVEKVSQHPEILGHVRSVHTYADYGQLAGIVRNGSWDIVHGHNEPNTPTAVAIENARCPVVYDCHDFSGLRQRLTGTRHKTERCCFEQSHAVIVVSENMAAVVQERYTPRWMVSLPCYCLVEEMERSSREKLPGNHLVYQGMLLDAGITPLEYRNYHPFFKKMVEHGIHVHVYCSAFNPKVQSSYIELRESSDLFHFHQQVPYARLLDEMGQYHWGLAAFNMQEILEPDKRLFLNSILPNKLFDYVFSGVCPVVYNNRTTGEWVERHDAGYHVRSENELIDVLLHAQPRQPVNDLSLISMEEHIRDIENLYHGLLG